MNNKMAINALKTHVMENMAKTAETKVVKASTYIEEQAAPKLAQKAEDFVTVYTSPFATTGSMTLKTAEPEAGALLNIFG